MDSNNSILDLVFEKLEKDSVYESTIQTKNLFKKTETVLSYLTNSSIMKSISSKPEVRKSVLEALDKIETSVINFLG